MAAVLGHSIRKGQSMYIYKQAGLVVDSDLSGTINQNELSLLKVVLDVVFYNNNSN